MFDITQFFKVSAEISPFVVIVVLGLTTFYGQLGAKGRVQLILAMLTGLLLGGSFLMALNGIPATFAGWFLTILVGLLFGLMAVGIYETGKGAIQKVTAKTLGIEEPKGKG